MRFLGSPLDPVCVLILADLRERKASSSDDEKEFEGGA